MRCVHTSRRHGAWQRVRASSCPIAAQVVQAALGKPLNIEYKGATDLVTDTDKASERACLEVIRGRFGGHALLGEEGGVEGDTASGYLWCIDPCVSPLLCARLGTQRAVL